MSALLIYYIQTFCGLNFSICQKGGFISCTEIACPKGKFLISFTILNHLRKELLGIKKAHRSFTMLSLSLVSLFQEFATMKEKLTKMVNLSKWIVTHGEKLWTWTYLLSKFVYILIYLGKISITTLQELGTLNFLSGTEIFRDALKYVRVWLCEIWSLQHE